MESLPTDLKLLLFETLSNTLPTPTPSSISSKPYTRSTPNPLTSLFALANTCRSYHLVFREYGGRILRRRLRVMIGEGEGEEEEEVVVEVLERMSVVFGILKGREMNSVYGKVGGNARTGKVKSNLKSRVASTPSPTNPDSKSNSRPKLNHSTLSTLLSTKTTTSLRFSLSTHPRLLLLAHLGLSLKSQPHAASLSLFASASFHETYHEELPPESWGKDRIQDWIPAVYIAALRVLRPETDWIEVFFGPLQLKSLAGFTLNGKIEAMRLEESEFDSEEEERMLLFHHGIESRTSASLEKVRRRLSPPSLRGTTELGARMLAYFVSNAIGFYFFSEESTLDSLLGIWQGVCREVSLEGKSTSRKLWTRAKWRVLGDPVTQSEKEYGKRVTGGKSGRQAAAVVVTPKIVRNIARKKAMEGPGALEFVLRYLEVNQARYLWMFWDAKPLGMDGFESCHDVGGNKARAIRLSMMLVRSRLQEVAENLKEALKRYRRLEVVGIEDEEMERVLLLAGTDSSMEWMGRRGWGGWYH